MLDEGSKVLPDKIAISRAEKDFLGPPFLGDVREPSQEPCKQGAKYSKPDLLPRIGSLTQVLVRASIWPDAARASYFKHGPLLQNSLDHGAHGLRVEGMFPIHGNGNGIRRPMVR